MPERFAYFDHIVVLLPYQDLINPPAWITKNFILSPGGKHGDGRTENRLIFFQDGTYLECIAFIHDDPAKREGHWWDAEYGFVDYALGTSKPLDREALLHRLEQNDTGISYDEAKRGGRTTPTGVSMTWDVTFPRGIERGRVPFWCHDITPRERRVPATDGSTRHPCGAVGIAGIVCEMDGQSTKRVEGALRAITRETKDANGGYAVTTPFDIGRLQSPTIQLKESRERFRIALVLQSPRKNGQKDIEESVGGGSIKIQFVT